MKFIVVTGGVISGLGKGITASSIGLLLKSYGYSVTAIKIDPYLNIDAGTMSPYEHGETFILHDGFEGDLDLGNYERFVDLILTKDHNITTGKIYNSVIQKERNGEYLGKTVQIIPHITNEIKDWIKRTANIKTSNTKPEICIIELGGTIGDLETAPFIEALRQLSMEEIMCFVHVSMIIDNGEQKTKPTQHSVALLRSIGIIPDLLVLRTKKILPDNILKKLEIFCHVKQENIICNIDVPNIYYVPDVFRKQNIVKKIANKLKLNISTKADLTNYNKVLKHYKSKNPIKHIIIAGKYVGSQDTYLSLIRALDHASFYCDCEPKITYLDTETMKDSIKILKSADSVIIPGGFGSRGIKGKLQVAKYCRENKIPLLGLCLGMQIMVVEYCRNVLNIDTYSSEWEKHENPVIYILPNQTEKMGGTMRLGNYTSKLLPNTLAHKLYKKDIIMERHRHRYEVNIKFKKDIESKGEMVFSGFHNDLMEIFESKTHPYYIGVQYHPELISRYNRPHPLFIGLLSN